ncbi:MAG: hypothetical protein IKR11_01925 [Solobacterium sp.]|nr:hypothetical protein [Solobacterium sp.]
MRRKLIEKLKSQTGASLSLALLLFLVCAAVGSVVLTAGTGAAGRLSRMAETDQRYYAVTSAAKFFNDLLENDETSVTLERIKTVKNTVTTTYKADGSIDGTPSKTEGDPDYSVRILVDEEEKEISDLGVISQLALSLYGIDSGNEITVKPDEIWDKMRADSFESKTYTLQFKTEDEVFINTDVLFEYKEGKLTVTLTDEIGDSDHYALVISAEPVFTENTSVKTTETSSFEGLKETKRVTTTTTKTSVLKWDVTGIEKAVPGNE